jgi:ribosomal protein S17E
MRICSVEDCGQKHVAKGLCNKHYAQLLRFGHVKSRTGFDSNEYIVKEDVCEVHCFNNSGDISDIFIIDKECKDKCIPYRWSSSKGYIRNKMIGSLTYFILGIKPVKGYMIDHINRNPRDNRKANLRFCTVFGNVCNSKKGKNNTSGYVGVRYNKQKNNWLAEIYFERTPYYLGSFKIKEEAASAYNKAAKEMHGEFAYQNEIKPTIKRRTNRAPPLGLQTHFT